MPHTDHKVCLVILDGWGHGKGDLSDAIFQSDTPFADHLDITYPHSELRTDGENVGLPDGQMGNSEVGHMNIGAGRVVYQDLVRINIAVRDGSFDQNPALVNAIKKSIDSGVSLHLMGLVSDGGVHSHTSHLKAICALAHRMHCPVYVHAFTDGRDTDPRSGKGYIESLENQLKGTTGKVASIIGRYYAMDRDKRWERIRKAHDLLVSGKGQAFTHSSQVMDYWYEKGVTDEFIEPSVITDSAGQPLAQMREGDVVICFNFRTDRCREITEVLTQHSLPEYQMHPLSLHYVTMTKYDDTFKNVEIMFDKDNLESTLGEVVARAGKTQVRIAETEKYPHVTFFFSGGREKEFEGERRLLVRSPSVATYDLQPEMSAPQIADAICADMISNQPDFICLNFANPDMVGHTGVFDAIVKAVETTDRCLQQVVETGLNEGYSFLIIADHGNADCAINEDGTPNTAHTTNPVPAWIIHHEISRVHSGKLADVAPTILDMMDLAQPALMTGRSLIG